jgi:hypothetical protein
MSSVGDGVGKGMGCVFGGAIAAVILVVAMMGLGKVAQPCSSCHGSGNCALCGGTGQGILWGDCLNCGGKKSCPNCGGVGFKMK